MMILVRQQLERRARADDLLVATGEPRRRLGIVGAPEQQRRARDRLRALGQILVDDADENRPQLAGRQIVPRAEPSRVPVDAARADRPAARPDQQTPQPRECPQRRTRARDNVRLRQTGHAHQHDRAHRRQMAGGKTDADSSAERMADENRPIRESDRAGTAGPDRCSESVSQSAGGGGASPKPGRSIR